MEERKMGSSLGQLFGDLARQASTLARQELEYAKVELSRKIVLVSKDVIYVCIGGLLVYAGLLCLLAAAVCALALLAPWWLAALIVAVGALFFGFLILIIGINRVRRLHLTLDRTMGQLKEDKEWLRKQIT